MGSMIEFAVTVDGEFIYALRADGLIVASAHGFHRLRALGGRTDPAPGAPGDRARADLAAHALESTGRHSAATRASRSRS
jgi:hypothetical protein